MLTVVVLAVGLVGLQKIGPVHRSCTATAASVCRSDTDIDVTLSTTEYLTGDGCVLCHTPHCNLSNPSTGLLCRPYVRECAMCGDPDVSMIGDAYSVVVRPNCNSVERCDGTALFNSTVLFDRIDT